MTRKDYEKIAMILNQQEAFAHSINAIMLLSRLIEDFADMLAKDNPHFDRQRFLKAAGYER
jgi:hypothetical protein